MLEKYPGDRISLKEVCQTRWMRQMDRRQRAPSPSSKELSASSDTTSKRPALSNKASRPSIFIRSSEMEIEEGKITRNNYLMSPKFLNSSMDKSWRKSQFLLQINSFLLGSITVTHKTGFSSNSSGQTLGSSGLRTSKLFSQDSSLLEMLKEHKERKREEEEACLSTRRKEDLAIEKIIGKMKRFECKWIKF